MYPVPLTNDDVNMVVPSDSLAAVSRNTSSAAGVKKSVAGRPMLVYVVISVCPSPPKLFVLVLRAIMPSPNVLVTKEYTPLLSMVSL